MGHAGRTTNGVLLNQIIVMIISLLVIIFDLLVAIWRIGVIIVVPIMRIKRHRLTSIKVAWGIKVAFQK